METWTPELLLQHLKAIIEANDLRYQERFSAQEKAIAAALNSQEKAVRTSEINSDKWRANANEWRAAMTDRDRNFVSSAEFKLIKERMDLHEGEGTGMKNMWGIIVAGIAIMISVVTFIAGRSNTSVDSQQIQQNGNFSESNGKKIDDMQKQIQTLLDRSSK